MEAGEEIHLFIKTKKVVTILGIIQNIVLIKSRKTDLSYN